MLKTLTDWQKSVSGLSFHAAEAVQTACHKVFERYFTAAPGCICIAGYFTIIGLGPHV